MRFRTGLLVGLAVGYYYGARAGRERYEQIEEALDRLRATAAYRELRTKVSDGIREGTSAVRTMVEDAAFGDRAGLDDTEELFLGEDADREPPSGTVRSLFTDPTLN